MVFVSDSDGWGGTEVLWERAARCARDDGHTVTVIQAGHSVLESKGHLDGVCRFVTLPTRCRETSALRWLRLFAELRPRTIAFFKGNIDLRAPALDVAARAVGARYVLIEAHIAPPIDSPNDDDALGGVRRYVGWAARRRIPFWMHARLASCIISSSDFVRRRLIEHYRYPESVVAVPPGVDTAVHRRDETRGARLRHHLGVAERTLVLGAAGRIARVKRIDLLVNAFSRALRQVEGRARLHLLVGGEGKELPKVRQLVVDLGLQEHVSFLGWVESIPEFNSALDLYVMTSEAEGFGIALLEAMATECHCIATDAGGPREIVGRTHHGVIVEDDSVASLASAMVEAVLLPPRERRERGIRARSSVMNLYEERIQTNAMTNAILG